MRLSEDVSIFRGQLEGREGSSSDRLWRSLCMADAVGGGSTLAQNPAVPFHLVSSRDIDRVLHQVRGKF